MDISQTESDIETRLQDSFDESSNIESRDLPTFPDALPQVIEENERVVRVIFPRYEKPPTGVDIRQIQLLRDASDFGVLPSLRQQWMKGVKRAVRYYGTDDFGTTIAKEEGVGFDTVYSSINSAMRKLHKLLSRLHPDLVEARYPDIDEIAVTKNRSEFMSMRMRHVFDLVRQANKS